MEFGKQGLWEMMGPENNGILGNPSGCNSTCCPTYSGPSGGPKTTVSSEKLAISLFLIFLKIMFKFLSGCRAVGLKKFDFAYSFTFGHMVSV